MGAHQLSWIEKVIPISDLDLCCKRKDSKCQKCRPSVVYKELHNKANGIIESTSPMIKSELKMLAKYFKNPADPLAPKPLDALLPELQNSIAQPKKPHCDPSPSD